MSDQDNLDQLKDAFDGHEVTNDDGQLTETTDSEEVPSKEETPVAEAEDMEQETAETNPEVAEDEDGKKYVPEGRFKEVYAKLKEAERKLKETSTREPVAPPMSGQSPDRASLLETELLHQTLPQFRPYNADGTRNPDYSEVLDEMGSEIYQSSFRFDPKTQSVMPTITKLEAARRAIDRAKKLVGSRDRNRDEVRVVKSQQSDSGFTSASKKVPEKNLDDMSLEEKEAYLKANGLW